MVRVKEVTLVVWHAWYQTEQKQETNSSNQAKVKIQSRGDAAHTTERQEQYTVAAGQQVH